MRRAWLVALAACRRHGTPAAAQRTLAIEQVRRAHRGEPRRHHRRDRDDHRTVQGSVERDLSHRAGGLSHAPGVQLVAPAQRHVGDQRRRSSHSRLESSRMRPLPEVQDLGARRARMPPVPSALHYRARERPPVLRRPRRAVLEHHRRRVGRADRGGHGARSRCPAGAAGVRAIAFNGAYGGTARDAKVTIAGDDGPGDACRRRSASTRASPRWWAGTPGWWRAPTAGRRRRRGFLAGELAAAAAAAGAPRHARALVEAGPRSAEAPGDGAVRAAGGRHAGRSRRAAGRAGRHAGRHRDAGGHGGARLHPDRGAGGAETVRAVDEEGVRVPPGQAAGRMARARPARAAAARGAVRRTWRLGGALRPQERVLPEHGPDPDRGDAAAGGQRLLSRGPGDGAEPLAVRRDLPRVRHLRGRRRDRRQVRLHPPAVHDRGRAHRTDRRHPRAPHASADGARHAHARAGAGLRGVPVPGGKGELRTGGEDAGDVRAFPAVRDGIRGGAAVGQGVQGHRQGTTALV